VLVIAGPTGAGKTAAAVALAARIPLEVVSADSRQVYRMLDAATGKPTAAERAAVTHHLVDVVDPDQRYQAARFRTDALAAIEKIRSAGHLPVVVGGTGLYIRALLRGLDPAPPCDPAFRQALEQVASRLGSAGLHAELAAVSPEAARKLHPHDRVRIIRALEVLRGGGVPPSEQSGWRHAAPGVPAVYVGLTMPRDRLATRLCERARAMARAGLREEVESLLGRYGDANLPGLRGIGYRQFTEVVRGRMDAETAVALMQRDTIRYAKRQWTWFAREPEIRWIDVESAGGAAGVAQVLVQLLGANGARP
jgi:tRNA dimethylallyltransferase